LFRENGSTSSGLLQEQKRSKEKPLTFLILAPMVDEFHNFLMSEEADIIGQLLSKRF
jgi:hypothetical protein